MTGSILPKISNKILELMSKQKMPQNVSLGVNKDGKFKVNFKN